MEYIIFKKERMPKSRISAFKAVYKTDSNGPYMVLIKDRKICIEPFDMNVELTEQFRYLVSVYKDFMILGEWFLNKNIIRSYKPKVNKKDNRYSINISSSCINDFSIKFKSEDGLTDALLKMDEAFNVIW